jgi:type II secretion system protein N
MIRMTPAIRRTLMALYIGVAAAVFLYVGFPSDAVRSHVSQRLSAGLPGLSLGIGALRPTVTAGLELTDVRIAYAQNAVAAFDRVRIQPDLLSLFQTNTGYSFTGSLGGGEVTGRAEVDAAGPAPKVSMNARIDGILVQQVDRLRSLYGHRLSGRLDGQLNTTATGALNGKLTITDGQIELASPLLAQSRFTFRTVEADLSLQNRSLLLRSGRLKGNELDADVSGTITLDPAQAANAMNLSGRVTPHHALLSRAEGTIPAGLLRRRAAIPFRISGSIDAPGFSLN